MKNQEIIDRYVYAVVRHLPRRQADDIGRELHGLIEDMLMERCGDRPAEQKDILVVLTELGTPQEMAAQYSTDKEICLIGQPWYEQYKLVLKYVLIAVGFGETIAMVVSFLVEHFGQPITIFDIFGQTAAWIGALISSTFAVVGALTAAYAILQRKGILPEESAAFSKSLLELPPVPAKKEKVSRADAICTIIISVLVMCVFLLAPQVICGVFGDGDAMEVIPVFSREVLRGNWYLFAGIALCGVVQGCFMLMEGLHTVRLAVVYTVTNVLSTVFFGIFAYLDGAMNPAFLAKAQEVFIGEDIWIAQKLLPDLLPAIFVVIIIASVLETGIEWYRALKYRQK